MQPFGQIAFTPAVQALQERHGSRANYARHAEAGPGDGLGPREAEYLAAADSFYLASVGETGWPYVQHRGGPPGFLRVVGPTRLAFADFRGNRQFVSAGNVSVDDRVALIVMDYPNQRRLKLLGHLRFHDATATDPALLAAVALPGYRARVERVATIEVAALDWNCPQHITPRYTAAEVESVTGALQARVAALEAELRSRHTGARDPLAPPGGPPPPPGDQP